MSVGSLRAALVTDRELHPVDVFSEDELDWNDPALLDKPAPTAAAPGWSWHQPSTVRTAPTWGGNLEILHAHLAANRWLRPVDDYAGCVLLLETSEVMPSATAVFRMLRDAGTRSPATTRPP